MPLAPVIWRTTLFCPSISFITDAFENVDQRVAAGQALNVAEVLRVVAADEAAELLAGEAVLDHRRHVRAAAVVREDDDAVVEQLVAVLDAAPGAAAARHPLRQAPLHLPRRG